MNSESFVDAVKRYVVKSAADGIVKKLENPPGRRPKAQLKALSDWFNALPPSDVDCVRRVAELAAHASIHTLFCALDGVTKIEDDGGQFELVYAGETRVLLNNSEEAFLHDLLTSEN